MYFFQWIPFYLLYYINAGINVGKDDICIDPQLNISEDGMEYYIRQSNWSCGHAVLKQVHDKKPKDAEAIFFATRSTVTKLKKDADGLLKMLDKNFALPQPVNCAFRSSQNETHIFALMRFSRIWDGQQGKWTRYSMEGGQGRVVNMDPLPFDVPPTIGKKNITMSITGEVLNSRYQYAFEHELFGEVRPEESTAEVMFSDSTGSMQMSSGASIPEIYWTFKKRRPKAWLRFLRSPRDEHPEWIGRGPAPDWMNEE